MHLHAFHRSAYYHGTSTITSRSTETDDTKIWVIIGPIIVTVITLVLVILLILWLRHRLSTRRTTLKAQGELAHFQTGSVRRTNRNASPGVKKRPASSPFVGRPPLPDPDQFEMYDLGLVTKPGLSYARQWNRPGHGEEAQTGTGLRHPAPTHPPAQLAHLEQQPTNPFEDANGSAQKDWPLGELGQVLRRDGFR